VVSVSAIARLLLDRDDAELPLAHHGVDTGDLAADGTQPPVALQLTGRRLEAEVEQFLLRLLQLLDESLLVLEPQLSGGQALSHHASPTSRFTILHFIGSLCIARCRASRPRRRQARTSRVRAGGRRPTSRASPCVNPSGSRRASA